MVEPNTFGTDEFVKCCRKVGAEPYLCTNANALPEEASDWVEYCNLLEDGEWAKLRIANGFQEPHHVKYWSIGNENYYKFEVAGMGVEEWLQYSERTAKMIKRVDPDVELTAALHCDNLEWTTRTLNELAGIFCISEILAFTRRRMSFTVKTGNWQDTKPV